MTTPPKLKSAEEWADALSKEVDPSANYGIADCVKHIRAIQAEAIASIQVECDRYRAALQDIEWFDDILSSKRATEALRYYKS